VLAERKPVEIRKHERSKRKSMGPKEGQPQGEKDKSKEGKAPL